MLLNNPLPPTQAQSANSALAQGIQLYRQERFSESLPYLQQAGTAAPSLESAQALNFLALSHLELGQLAPAETAIATSLKQLQTIGNQRPEGQAILAQAWNTQGWLQLSQGKAETALSTWQQAARLYETQRDPVGLIGSLINQAQAMQVMGLYQQAVTQLEKVNQVLQSEPDSLEKATGLRSLGNALRVVGDLSQSEQVLQQSLEMTQRLGNKQAIAETWLSLGHTLQSGLSPEDRVENAAVVQAALQSYQKAEAVSPLPAFQFQAKLSQLNLMLSSRRWQSAEPLLKQVKTQISSLPPNRTTLYAQVNLVQSLTQLKQPGTPSVNSIPPQPAIGGPEINSNIITKATPANPLPEFILVQRGPDLPQPRSTSGQRGPDSPSENRLVFQDLSVSPDSLFSPDTQLSLPDWQELAKMMATVVQQAQSLGDIPAQSYALGTLGGLYEQTGQLKWAQELTQQALFLSQSVRAGEISYRWQWQLGRIFRAMGDRTLAMTSYTEAVDTLQSLRRDLAVVKPDVQFSFRDSVEPVYRELVALLLPLDREPEQQHLIQARNLIEALQLAELENFFRQSCLNAQTVQIDQVDQSAGVLYPIILPDRVEVILSLPGKPLKRHWTSIPQAEVEQVLTDLRTELTSQASQNFLPLSQRVYNWLIRPIESELEQSKIQTLVFVSDGLMRNTPMSVLHDGQKYLIERYSLALAPGLQLLDVKPFEHTRFQVLAAGLSEARQGFKALPNVLSEIHQIQTEVPSQVLLNQQFTSGVFADQVKAFSGSVIHLATHGQFSSKPEGTYVLSWDSRIGLNQLVALLKNQDTNPSGIIELLVLSACQTALGDQRAALGLAGVAVRAGARSTIGTLWYVDDAATSSIMADFYKALTAAPGITKAEALRSSQLKLLHEPEFRHPYFWSPYILVGNWF